MLKPYGVKFAIAVPFLLGAIALGDIFTQAALAQNTPPIITPSPTTVPLTETIIFVAPNGVDMPGAGTQSRPLKTITAALSTNPQPGTVIQLAPGTYSAETGEVFPLKLLPGVKLRGNGNTKGEGILIRGGGKFISPTFAGQNIAILAAPNSHIGGLTITNNNPRGYGLWVESSKNVTIANNTFVNTTHDGVFLTGEANAQVTDNIFTRNTGSGISAVGTSSGEIRNNVFDNTGFGLSIGQQSQVILISNRIANNVDGIIISNTAKPVLRGNVITKNNRNGLVVLKDRESQPTPNLGTQAYPGQNVFKDNREKDILNASGVAVLAAGNDVNKTRVSGPIDWIANVSTQVQPVANVPPKVTPTTPTNTLPQTIVIERELPPVISTRPNSGNIIEKPIAISPIPVVRTNTGTPSSITPTTSALGTVRHRVIVPLVASVTASQVKRLVPDAFVSRHQGQSVMQVGVYGDRNLAEAQVKKLAQAGIKAQIDSK